MIAILFCACVLLILQVLTPFWWWIAVVPFLFGLLFAKKSGKAFGGGLLIGAIVWGGAGLYFFLTSGRLIAGRVAAMFSLGSGWLMVLVTGALGALVAALAAFSGYLVRGQTYTSDKT